MWRGTLTHLACEMEDAVAAVSLASTSDERAAIVKNLGAFLAWQQSNAITILDENKEVKLVSEVYQYGGTCDFVCKQIN